MSFNNFYDLDVWKESRRFKKLIYDLTKSFPATERYELTNQLIRAVRSISANLAEGHGRQTTRDELHFCIMARGSWSESLNHLIDAKDCGFISFDQLAEVEKDWDKLGRILSGYINYLRSQTSKSGSSGNSSEHDMNYRTSKEENRIDEAENDAESFRRSLND